jgi:hypothetical protein
LTIEFNKLATAAQAAVDLDAKQALRRDGAAFKFDWRDAINTAPKLTERQRRVGTDIARRVNSTTLTTDWISDAEIGDFLGIHRVHVQKARTELQRLGWIARKAGRFKSRYTLCSLNIDSVLQAAEDRQGVGRVLRGHPSRKKSRPSLKTIVSYESPPRDSSPTVAPLLFPESIDRESV